MSRFTLKYSEMAWWLIDSEAKAHFDKEMIGNARDVQLMRDGPDVLITSDSAGYPRSRIIPSDTTIKGFGPEKDDKALWEVTHIEAIYNSALREVK